MFDAVTFNLALDLLFQPLTLVMLVTGVTIGIVIGVLPGLGPPVALSLALPFTFEMSFVPSIVLLLANLFGFHIWRINQRYCSPYTRNWGCGGDCAGWQCHVPCRAWR